MKIIVSVSGGLSSAFALKMAIDRYGRDNVIAIFADVKGTGYSHFWSAFPELEYLLHERYGGESPDTYRFIWQLSHALDIPIIRLEDGRSIWAIFGQKRAFAMFAGTSTFCMASELLKREMIAQWVEASGLQQGEYRVALGMSVLEGHRTYRARQYWARRMGYEVDVFSPFDELYQETRKIADACVMMDWLNEMDVELPAAYRDGYPHNNCGGICVLAGQSQYVLLYELDRERYLYAAYQEQQLQIHRNINASILKVTRDGIGRGVSLFDFIGMIEAGDVNTQDIGQSCSCFTAAPAMTSFLAQVDVNPVPTKKVRRK